MISIEARIVKGMGSASENLARQLPLIAQEFPEIAGCHLGSINLELAAPLVVFGSDHRTKSIAWRDVQPRAEIFDFIRIEFEAPSGGMRIKAWLYIAHHSPHRNTPRIHEVIAPKLNLSNISICKIHIPRATFQLPTPTFPLVVVI
jgi:hypothetical protein